MRAIPSSARPRRWPMRCTRPGSILPCWPTTTAATADCRVSARPSVNWSAAASATRASSATRPTTGATTRCCSDAAASRSPCSTTPTARTACPSRPVRSSTALTPRPWRATWPQHGTPAPTASPSASTGATSTNAVRMPRSGRWPALCGGTAPTSLSAATRTSCSPTRPTRPPQSSTRWEISSRTSAAGTATAVCWPRSR